MPEEPSNAEVGFEREWRARMEESAGGAILLPNSFLTVQPLSDREYIRKLRNMLDDRSKENMSLILRLKKHGQALNDQKLEIDRLAEENRVANIKLMTCQCKHEFTPAGVVVTTRPLPLSKPPAWIRPALTRATYQFALVGALYFTLVMLGVDGAIAMWPTPVSVLGASYVYDKTVKRTIREGSWL